VPAFDNPFSLRSVEVATRLAGSTKGAVLLAYFVEVPRALALDASIPESEIVASECLEQARDSAVLLQVPTDIFVHRTRSARDGILKLIAEEKVDLIVLGGRADNARGLSHDLIRELFERAPCEVVLDFIPAGR
jgi:nucleotide-binding universal stress UspA family protein